MTRIFAAAGVIVAGIIVCGLALGWLLAPALSEAAIKQAVARDTGRTITFAGRPRLSVWPELAIELRGVELSNPAEMSEGRFAAADTVRLKISGESLWRRAPAVAEVVVVGARINLLVDGEGRSNFAFERASGAEPEGASAAPPIIIVDGSIKYLNERSAAAFAASSVDVTLVQSGIARPLELDGAFNWHDQRLKVAFYAKSSSRLTADGSPADFTIAGPHVNAAFSGRAAIRDGLELAGTLQFKAEPLADLLSWAGLATPLTGSLPALSAGGSLDLSGGAIRMTQAKLSFGPMNAKGDVALSFSGPKPQLKANLGIDRIDLDGLAGEKADGLALGWNDAPLDLEFLKFIDAELSLAVSELAYGRLATGPSRLDVGLAGGKLEARLADAKLYGGSASGRMTLDGAGPVAALDVTLKASGVDGGKLIAGLAGDERVRGQADFDLELAATGASSQELVGRLGGKAHVRLRGGALVELDVPAMLGHVATDVAEGWTAAEGRETPFSLLEASFSVEDGIAETDNLRLDGPLTEVSGMGSIDLLRRRLDLRVRPQVVAADGKGLPSELPVAVVIEGSWSAPKIYPDVEGILKHPEEAYAALRKLIEVNAAKLDLGTETVEEGPSEAAAEP